MAVDLIAPIVAPLVSGVICGVMVSAPVGPVGVLALMRLAEHKPREAHAIAFGAVLADLSAAFVASIGVNVVVHWLLGLLPDWLVDARVVGTVGAFLLLMLAVEIISERPPKPNRRVVEHRSWWVVGFAAAMGNPGNFAAFAAAFAWLHGVFDLSGLRAHVLLLAGVLAGAAGCWTLFMWLAERFLSGTRMGKRLVDKLVKWLRWLLAALLVMTAVGAVVHGWL